jgi:hypothetical protein
LIIKPKKNIIEKENSSATSLANTDTKILNNILAK